MLLKAGVDISRLKREIRRSLPIAAAVLASFGEELTVTETYGGVHGEGSLHYSDDAYDLRRPLENATIIVSQFMAAMGTAFDVVLESNHIHVEYDPD